MRYLAADFETSGLSSNDCAPVSLGVALMEDGEVIDSRDWIVQPKADKNGKPSHRYEVGALEVSGLTWGQIKHGTPADQVCAELRLFADERGVRDAAVVAFNAPFDFGFYAQLLFMAGNWNQQRRCFQAFAPPLTGPWQCARMMAFERCALKSYSLDAVSAHFGFTRSTDKHGALEDAVLAGKVYHALTQIQLQAVAS